MALYLGAEISRAVIRIVRVLPPIQERDNILNILDTRQEHYTD